MSLFFFKNTSSSDFYTLSLHDALPIFIHDLDVMFDNLRGARDRLRKGIVASDEIKKHLKNADPSQRTGFRVEVRAELRESTNPLHPAEYRYMREHGQDNFNQLLERLFVELFPSE